LFAIIVAAVVLLGAVVVATSLTKEEADRPSDTQQFGAVEVSGAAPAKFDSTVADPAVGAAAPVIFGVDFSNRSMSIGDTGRPTLVVFLAHWCPHCNRETPRLRAYLDAAGVPTDVDILLVLTGSNETAVNWPPSSWIKDQGLGDMPLLLDDDDGTAANALGLDGYPFLVLLDADGKVIERRSGEQPDGAFAEMIATLRGA
jgi:thiol-disulfide isomerase/thioredoxin